MSSLCNRNIPRNEPLLQGLSFRPPHAQLQRHCAPIRLCGVLPALILDKTSAGFALQRGATQMPACGTPPAVGPLPPSTTPHTLPSPPPACRLSGCWACALVLPSPGPWPAIPHAAPYLPGARVRISAPKGLCWASLLNPSIAHCRQTPGTSDHPLILPLTVLDQSVIWDNLRGHTNIKLLYFKEPEPR